MKEASANEDAIDGCFRIQPFREVESGLDQQKLPVRVPNADGKIREGFRDFEEEVNNEPLILKIVPEAEVAGEVGDGREGYGKRERLVLPNIRGSNWRNVVEYSEMEELELGGGGGGEGGIREDGVENGVVGGPGILEGKE